MAVKCQHWPIDRAERKSGSPISRPGVKGQIVSSAPARRWCPAATSYLNLGLQATRSHPVFRSLALRLQSAPVTHQDQASRRCCRHAPWRSSRPRNLSVPPRLHKVAPLLRAQILWLPRSTDIGTNPVVADAAGDLRDLCIGLDSKASERCGCEVVSENGCAASRTRADVGRVKGGREAERERSLDAGRIPVR